MKETAENRQRVKKGFLALVLSGIFFFGIFGSEIQAEAATNSELLNTVIPIIIGYNESGEPVGVSFGIPLYTEELGIILVSSEAYMGTCSTYLMGFYTESGSTVEMITPLAASEEYKVVFFCLQADSAFTASFQAGSIGNVTTDTVLINVLLSDGGELYEASNYCAGKEGNFYRLTYSLEGMLGGSLVFNSEDSTVVGMVVAEGDGTYFVDIETIGVLYQRAINETTGGQDAGGGSTGGSGTGGSGTGGQGAGGSTGGSGTGGVWGFIILGIVIVLGVLLYNYSKKGKEGGKKSEYALSLMGISGIHAGAVFPLNELLIFGRDKNKCNLIFSGDTQGISGVHCQVNPVEDGVELMDLGSSYGTFLQNGTRLTPHTPYVLRKGDGFYLADRQYGYRVQ